MTESVKLSRERWSSLTSQWPHSWENPVNPDQRVVRKPIEIDGITFLPATYVPGDFPVRRGGQKYMTCAWNYDGTRLR